VPNAKNSTQAKESTSNYPNNNQSKSVEKWLLPVEHIDTDGPLFKAMVFSQNLVNPEQLALVDNEGKEFTPQISNG